MTNTEQYVYLLIMTRTRENWQWSGDREPPKPTVFADAWSAIDAGRATFKEVEKVAVESADHEEGIVWIGRLDNIEAIVRRHQVWSATPLGGQGAAASAVRE